MTETTYQATRSEGGEENMSVVPSPNVLDGSALPQLLVLSEAATPGPWICGVAQNIGWQAWIGQRGEKNSLGVIEDATDAAFIVAAVNYVRSLESKSGGGTT